MEERRWWWLLWRDFENRGDTAFNNRSYIWTEDNLLGNEAYCIHTIGTFPKLISFCAFTHWKANSLESITVCRFAIIMYIWVWCMTFYPFFCYGRAIFIKYYQNYFFIFNHHVDFNKAKLPFSLGDW